MADGESITGYKNSPSQRSFISKMEWEPFKSLFWKGNGSIVKLTLPCIMF